MQKPIRQNSNRIVFSKWSRNGYAIFASLKKVVNIAQLSIDICKASLLKNNSLVNIFSLVADDNDERVDLCEEMLDNQQFIQLLPIVVTNSDITPKQKIIFITIMGSPYFASCRVWAFCF